MFIIDKKKAEGLASDSENEVATKEHKELWQKKNGKTLTAGW